jgi:hypothetical protein
MFATSVIFKPLPGVNNCPLREFWVNFGRIFAQTGYPENLQETGLVLPLVWGCLLWTDLKKRFLQFLSFLFP